LDFFSDFGESKFAEAVVVVQEAKAFANDFAGGLVKAAFDFAFDESFEFRGQGDIHEAERCRK